MEPSQGSCFPVTSPVGEEVGLTIPEVLCHAVTEAVSAAALSYSTVCVSVVSINAE